MRFTEQDGGNVLKEESFWIRFWRRPGLKANGVVEGKGTGRDEVGHKIRIKQIVNLALTPQEVAQVKKDTLVEDVVQQGRVRVEQQTVSDDPFAERVETRQMDVRVPEFEVWEVKELERLDRLATMTR